MSTASTIPDSGTASTARLQENIFPIRQEKTCDDEVRCRHCGMRLYGMDRALIDQCMEDMHATDWLVPCPRCENPIG